MKKIKIFAFGEVEYESFFDADTQTEHVVVYFIGDRMGSALIQIPNESDEEDMQRFKEELEEWFFDNYLHLEL